MGRAVRPNPERKSKMATAKCVDKHITYRGDVLQLWFDAESKIFAISKNDVMIGETEKDYHKAVRRFDKLVVTEEERPE